MKHRSRPCATQRKRLTASGCATLAFALVATVAASPAWAAADDEPPMMIRELHIDDEVSAENEADRLAASGAFEAARAKYLFALNRIRSPELVYKLADVEDRSGHLLESFERFRELLRETDPSSETMRVLSDSSPKTKARIDELRTKAEQRLESLASRIAQLQIDAPALANVAVDGHRVASRPFVSVLPGRHHVAATLDGKVADISVDSQAGDVRRVTLLGGANLTGPMAHVDGTSSVVTSQSRSLMGWAVPGALALVGLAGVATGLGLTLKSQRTKGDGTTAEESSSSTLAWAGFIGGGALLAGAAALFILWPKAPPAGPHTRVAPIVGSNAAGAVLDVSF